MSDAAAAPLATVSGEPTAPAASPAARPSEPAGACEPAGVGVSRVEAGGVVAAAPWSGRLDRHPAAVYLARLAPSGRRTQRTALATMAGWLSGGAAGVFELAWQRLGYAHTQAVRAALAERYAPATANRHLSALRGVLGECWRLGLMTAEAHARASDVAAVRGVSPSAGRAVTAGELAALFASCATGRAGDARDAALLALLYGGGLRRDEAAGLDVGDFEAGSGRVVVRRGKGAKARVVWAAGGAGDAVAAWLAHRGQAAGPLLCPVDKAGRVALRRLSGHAVARAVARRARRAGVAAFTPHDLRRSFVGDLLDRGVDIATAAELAGHAQVTTTAGYDRRPEATRRRAVEALHVPYTAPPPAGPA